ncbi:MAG: hypothetical protein N2234_08260, partial [Planctomycetota bacterium]|nr:hypothetical protein [Planctomycetota bacterium]
MRNLSLPILFVAVCAALFGCKGSNGAATPEDAIKAMTNAFNSRNAEKLYFLLSTRIINELEKNLNKLKAQDDSSKQMACAIMGIEPVKLNEMTTKDFFIAILNSSFNMMDKMAEAKGEKEKSSFSYEILDTKIEGDKAVVKTKRQGGMESVF